MPELSRSQTPNGGWQFVQPQTGWAAPTPIASTFDQTVQLILRHRLANPAIVAKHHLSLDPQVIGAELEAFTRTRLHLTDALSQPVRAGTPVQAGGCCGS